LSDDTLRVVDAVRNVSRIETALASAILPVLAALETGKTYPPLIAVEDGEVDLILVEGLTRVTAYAVLGPRGPVDFLIGTSPNIEQWPFR
jgi:hypothetical protein